MQSCFSLLNDRQQSKEASVDSYKLWLLLMLDYLEGKQVHDVIHNNVGLR